MESCVVNIRLPFIFVQFIFGMKLLCTFTNDYITVHYVLLYTGSNVAR